MREFSSSVGRNEVLYFELLRGAFSANPTGGKPWTSSNCAIKSRVSALVRGPVY